MMIGLIDRMDTTLVDFNDMKWERGDITFLYHGDETLAWSMKVLDNKCEVFQRIRYQVSMCAHWTDV